LLKKLKPQLGISSLMMYLYQYFSKQKCIPESHFYFYVYQKNRIFIKNQLFDFIFETVCQTGTFN
jgi:hypothetical protein